MPDSQYQYILLQQCVDYPVFPDSEFIQSGEFAVQGLTAPGVVPQDMSDFA